MKRLVLILLLGLSVAVGAFWLVRSREPVVQARRYLDVMLPYALDFSYSEPDGVHVH